MPKNRVYAPGQYDVDGEYVLVGWFKESQEVQLASCYPSKDRLNDVIHDNGFFVSLDLEGVNSLIRSLKRARKQAFDL